MSESNPVVSLPPAACRQILYSARIPHSTPSPAPAENNSFSGGPLSPEKNCCVLHPIAAVSTPRPLHRSLPRRPPPRADQPRPRPSSRLRREIRVKKRVPQYLRRIPQHLQTVQSSLRGSRSKRVADCPWFGRMRATVARIRPSHGQSATTIKVAVLCWCLNR